MDLDDVESNFAPWCTAKVVGKLVTGLPEAAVSSGGIQWRGQPTRNDCQGLITTRGDQKWRTTV